MKGQTDEIDPQRKDLYEAVVIAEAFEEAETKAGFVIPEGYDLFEILKAVVTLHRAFRSERQRAGGEPKPIQEVIVNVIKSTSCLRKRRLRGRSPKPQPDPSRGK